MNPNTTAPTDTLPQGAPDTAAHARRSAVAKLLRFDYLLYGKSAAMALLIIFAVALFPYLLMILLKRGASFGSLSELNIIAAWIINVALIGSFYVGMGYFVHNKLHVGKTPLYSALPAPKGTKFFISIAEYIVLQLVALVIALLLNWIIFLIGGFGFDALSLSMRTFINPFVGETLSGTLLGLLFLGLTLYFGLPLLYFSIKCRRYIYAILLQSLFSYLHLALLTIGLFLGAQFLPDEPITVADPEPDVTGILSVANAYLFIMSAFFLYLSYRAWIKKQHRR